MSKKIETPLTLTVFFTASVTLLATPPIRLYCVERKCYNAARRCRMKHKSTTHCFVYKTWCPELACHTSRKLLQIQNTSGMELCPFMIKYNSKWKTLEYEISPFE